MRRFLPLLFVVTLTACSASAPAPQPGSSSSSSSSVMTPDGWKRQENAALQFSIALPADWTTEAQPDSTRYSGGTPPVAMQVSCTTETFASLAAGLQARDAANATGWEGQPSVAVQTTQNVTINAQSAVERREEYLAAGLTAVATYFLHDGHLCAFASRPDDADVISDVQILQHRQIMATIDWR